MMAEKSKARPITDSVTEISVWNYPFTKYCVNSNYSTYTTYTITQHTICTEFQPSFHQTAEPDLSNVALNAEHQAAYIYTFQVSSPVWPFSFEIRH
jgi:hypothetical protein